MKQPETPEHAAAGPESADAAIAAPARRIGRRSLLAGLPFAIGAIVLGERARPAQAGTDGDWTLHGNNLGPGKFFGTTNNRGIVIKTHGATRMTITKGGKVGVGTISPRARLAAKTTETDGTAISGVAPNGASAPTARGVAGTGTVGVVGTGDSMGVQGITTTGVGVKGEASGSGGSVKAVYGKSIGSNNNGVVGEASNGAAAYGVWGISTAGYAGVFSGKVLVTGTLSKGGGSFKIDHPLDPANKYLYHSFVESPDMMNVYNGNVVTNAAGDAVVELPDYFGALNRDFRYQLTVVGQFAQAIVAEKISGNRFTIKTDKPGVEVSWQVTGIRQDAFANANRIPVEETKPAAERGLYLHPKAHGKPGSMDVRARRMAGVKA